MRVADSRAVCRADSSLKKHAVKPETREKIEARAGRGSREAVWADAYMRNIQPDAEVRHLSLVRERVREIPVGLEVARVDPPAVAYRIVCRIGEVIERRRQSEARRWPPNSPRAQPQPRLVAIAPLDPDLDCLRNATAEKQGEEERGPG